MAKILTEDKNKKILLIDADPTAGLLYALGVKPKKTVGEIREELKGKDGMDLNRGKFFITPVAR